MRLICAADDCDERFEPVIEGQIYHSKNCAARMRMRRMRERKRHLPGGPPPPGPRRLPSRNQLMLFSSSTAKPPKSAKQQPLFSQLDRSPKRKAVSA